MIYECSNKRNKKLDELDRFDDFKKYWGTLDNGEIRKKILELEPNSRTEYSTLFKELYIAWFGERFKKEYRKKHPEIDKNIYKGVENKNTK